MIRFTTILIVLVLVVSSNAYPADAPVQAVELAADAKDLTDSAAATSNDDADLQGSETFGFGFYPRYYGGYGGYGGYGRSFGGYGGYGGYGYGRRWGYGYGGYGGYGGYYRRPIYPVWG